MPSRNFCQYLEDAKRGDDSAMAFLVAEFEPLVRGKVSDLVPNSPDMSVRDSIQEVWLKVWEGISTFRGSDDPGDCRALFKAWLALVAQRAAIDILRRAKAVKNGGGLQKDPLPDVVGADKTPSSDANGRLQSERLREAISRMDPLDAEVIRLRCFECLKLREIAAKLDLTVDQIRTIFDRGMRFLAREMDE